MCVYHNSIHLEGKRKYENWWNERPVITAQLLEGSELRTLAHHAGLRAADVDSPGFP